MWQLKGWAPSQYKNRLSHTGNMTSLYIVYVCVYMYWDSPPPAVGNKNRMMETCIINTHMRPMNDIQLVW